MYKNIHQNTKGIFLMYITFYRWNTFLYRYFMFLGIQRKEYVREHEENLAENFGLLGVKL